MIYRTEPLSDRHVRSRFTSGVSSLDSYLRIQANQDIRRNLSACFVATDANAIVTGYYTLSGYSIPAEEAPEALQKKFPRAYKVLPAILLGRLAVDKRMQGQGHGGELLMDAMKRCLELSAVLGSWAMVVDPIDGGARAFYDKYGFMQLASGKMFLPMKTIEALVA